MEIHVAPITKPDELSLLLGQSHSGKAVEAADGIARRKGLLRTIGYRLCACPVKQPAQVAIGLSRRT